MIKEEKLLGVVNEIGLERNEEQFSNFNLKVGVLMRTDKRLSYNEGERLIRQLRKELLGKNIEFEAIAIPCPICGKTFNSELGMKQHLRRQHNDEQKNYKKNKKPLKKTGITKDRVEKKKRVRKNKTSK
jgi:hypothetical protein